MNNDSKTFGQKQEEVKGEIKHTAQEYADTAKEYVSDLAHKAKDKGDELKEQATDIVDSIDEYAHKKPWAMIAGAATLGLIIGLSVQVKKNDHWR